MEDKEVNDPHGQIVYTPLLDQNRDEKILKVLPDYLTDEIMFAREQGSSIAPQITNPSEHVLLAIKSIPAEESGLLVYLLYNTILQCVCYFPISLCPTSIQVVAMPNARSIPIFVQLMYGLVLWESLILLAFPRIRVSTLSRQQLLIVLPAMVDQDSLCQ